MKVEKLNESVFDKFQDYEAVIDAVTNDAIDEHDERAKFIDKVLKDRGFGKEFTGAEKQPVPEEVKLPTVTLDESLFDVTTADEVLQEKHDKSLPPTDEWQALGKDTRENYDFWDKIYAELIQDASFSADTTRNSLREIPDPDPSRKDKGRYREDNFSITPDGDIRINVVSEDALDFAKKVADYYGIRTKQLHTDRRVRYPESLVLFVTEAEDSDMVEQIVKNTLE